MGLELPRLLERPAATAASILHLGARGTAVLRLEDLVFCSARWPRLSELAAQVLIEQQAAAPAMPVDPELESPLPY